MVGRLLRLPREVYRRANAMRAAREEARFQTRLRIELDAPALILSPHWDDAVLDCFRLLAADGAVNVLNVFGAVPAPGTLALWDAITGASDSAQRARERIAEDATALAKANRKQVNLPFLDAQYRRPPAPPLEDLDVAVTSHVQSASRVYVPAGLGAHPDHLLTRRYGRMLLRAGMPVTLYADLPYCVFHGWPDWVDGRHPDAHRNVDAFWQSFVEDVPEMPSLRSAHVERLPSELAARKLEAMRCYETQFACLSYGASELLADPALHGFEVSWELAPLPAPAAD